MFEALKRLFSRAPAPQPSQHSQPPAPAPVPTPSPRFGSVICQGSGGLHRMAYTEWGDPDNPEVVVCVHGLTRTGRDFDTLARALAPEYRVVCPDVVGRGRSDWLQDKRAYGFPQYVADLITLIARLDVDSIQWVGTSMGGLIGMCVASQVGTPIRRLVLNDVGPLVTAESLRRLGEYVGKAPLFASLEDAQAYIRNVSAPFGPLSDEQWAHLTEHCVRERPDGQWEMCYDQAIGAPFRETFMYVDVDMWPIYDQIRCPTLVVRGAESDLLRPDTAAAMTTRGPRARVAEVPGVGHAPTFMVPGQIALVADFLQPDALEFQLTPGASAPMS